jgi:hypothetical protein
VPLFNGLTNFNNFFMNQFANIGKPIIVASHPRSGTHLTIDLLRKQFPACASYKLIAQPLDRLYLALEALTAPSQKSISVAKALEVLRKAERPIIKTHADPALSHLEQRFSDWQEWLSQEATVLYIIRDGRAALCSFHLYMQSYDPSTRCSLSDFIRQTTNRQSRVKQWANHVEQWLAQPNVYSIRFEEIVKQTPNTLNRLSQILELKADLKEPLLPISIRSLWHGRWVRLSQANPESTAIIGYYKGRKSATWKTAFTRADHAFFEAEAGDLLRKLGYLSSHNSFGNP